MMLHVFMALKRLMSNTLRLSTFEINQMIGIGRWNKQPTMDLFDRMVILSTCFSNNNVLFNLKY